MCPACGSVLSSLQFTFKSCLTCLKSATGDTQSVGPKCNRQAPGEVTVCFYTLQWWNVSGFELLSEPLICAIFNVLKGCLLLFSVEFIFTPGN